MLLVVFLVPFRDHELPPVVSGNDLIAIRGQQGAFFLKLLLHIGVLEQ